MKERILVGAFELFRQYGIKTISMDDIAQNLGISKKTIYKFFQNKDQLVEETFAAYLDDIKNTGTQPNNNAIEEFCCTINKAIQKLTQLPVTFFHDLKKYHYPAYQTWAEYKQHHIVALFQANITRGIQSGLYRSDVDPTVTARLYLGLLQTIYNSELFPPAEFNLQETYQQNLKHFLLGIVSPAGLKTIQQYQIKHQENQTPS